MPSNTVHINCWQAHLKPFCGVNRNAIFWRQNLLALIQREKEFDFQSISDNKNLKIPNTFKKYRGTGTSVSFLKKYRRYR